MRTLWDWCRRVVDSVAAWLGAPLAPALVPVEIDEPRTET